MVSARFSCFALYLIIVASIIAVALTGADADLVLKPKTYCRFDGKFVMKNLVKGLTAAGNYTTFLAALKKTKLDSDLQKLFNCYEATVFAPNDAAFAALPEDAKNATSENSKVLRELLLHHVVQKKTPFAALVALPAQKQFKAAADGCKARLVKVSAKGDQAFEVEAQNGPNETSVVAADVISLRVLQVHGVDDVILPAILKASKNDQLSSGKCPPWAA